MFQIFYHHSGGSPTAIADPCSAIPCIVLFQYINKGYDDPFLRRKSSARIDKNTGEKKVPVVIKIKTSVPDSILLRTRYAGMYKLGDSGKTFAIIEFDNKGNKYKVNDSLPGGFILKKIDKDSIALLYYSRKYYIRRK